MSYNSDYIIPPLSKEALIEELLNIAKHTLFEVGNVSFLYHSFESLVRNLLMEEYRYFRIFDDGVTIVMASSSVTFESKSIGFYLQTCSDMVSIQFQTIYDIKGCLDEEDVVLLMKKVYNMTDAFRL